MLQVLPGGGELPYEEQAHGGVPRVRVTFSRENSEKGMPIFNTNSRKGYNICKNFQIGSAILMAQMTNQMKTKLTDYFHLVSGLKSTILENFLKMEAVFFPKQPSKSYFGQLH